MLENGSIPRSIVRSAAQNLSSILGISPADPGASARLEYGIVDVLLSGGLFGAGEEAAEVILELAELAPEMEGFAPRSEPALDARRAATGVILTMAFAIALGVHPSIDAVIAAWLEAERDRSGQTPSPHAGTRSP